MIGKDISVLIPKKDGMQRRRKMDTNRKIIIGAIAAAVVVGEPPSA